jgi:hypothetical protein
VNATICCMRFHHNSDVHKNAVSDIICKGQHPFTPTPSVSITVRACIQSALSREKLISTRTHVRNMSHPPQNASPQIELSRGILKYIARLDRSSAG